MDTALDASRPLPTRPWERVAAGAVLLMAALGLIMLGGCFLLGAVFLLTNVMDHSDSTPVSLDERALLVTCYVMTGACLVGALLLLLLAVRGLLKVLRGKASS